MGLFSKDISSLEDLYKHGLQDMYYAENQIVKSLPAMIDKATHAELKRGLQQHLRETEEQVHRLEQVFQLHGEEASGEKCPAMDGIIKEGEDLMGEVDDEDVLSAGIIAAAQAVEHYEITRYGALIAWAKELGRNRDAALLVRNLNEEKAADKKLTALAEQRVNPKSAKGVERGARQPRQSQARSAGRRTAATRRKPIQKKRKAAGRRR
jgi:ferritin-like metal-binding protein YciE